MFLKLLFKKHKNVSSSLRYEQPRTRQKFGQQTFSYGYKYAATITSVHYRIAYKLFADAFNSHVTSTVLSY